MWGTIKWVSKVVWYGWWRIVYFIFALIGGYDTIVSQFTADNKVFEPLSLFIPQMEYWHWWVILLLFIILAMGVGSYKLHNKIIKEIQDNQKVIHSDSANRLFAININNIDLSVSPEENKPKNKNTFVLKLSVSLVAFPPQKLEAIKLELHDKTYDCELPDTVTVGVSALLTAEPWDLYFDIPDKFKKGEYTALLAVYIDGKKEPKEFKFKG